MAPRRQISGITRRRALIANAAGGWPDDAGVSLSQPIKTSVPSY